ncbi:unnamed protein product [Meganyctiphanes norvegica]|uniref:Uncharacterized protein n=1 Tax=Meganyctiphanes norvegica TaxID=48144 RepID=A0AAV2QZI4_MEGNR
MKEIHLSMVATITSFPISINQSIISPTRLSSWLNPLDWEVAMCFICWDSISSLSFIISLMESATSSGRFLFIISLREFVPFNFLYTSSYARHSNISWVFSSFPTHY